MVDRSAFDRIQHAGGYISVNTSGNTQDANAIPIEKEDADEAFYSAACIGCGACVAACKNASASCLLRQRFLNMRYCHKGKIEAKDEY